MTLRAAIYLRHSTDLAKTANQRPQVEQLARARGYELAAVFDEGTSAVKKRPEYERMMMAAKKGTFDVVIVWALDRFGRSIIGNLTDVLELDRIGVKVAIRTLQMLRGSDLGERIDQAVKPVGQLQRRSRSHRRRR